VRHNGLILTFSPDTKLEPEKVIQWFEKRPERFQFLSDKKLRVETGTEKSLDAIIKGKKVLEAFTSTL
jgi:hypothetical protein